MSNDTGNTGATQPPPPWRFKDRYELDLFEVRSDGRAATNKPGMTLQGRDAETALSALWWLHRSGILLDAREEVSFDAIKFGDTLFLRAPDLEKAREHAAPRSGYPPCVPGEHGHTPAPGECNLPGYNIYSPIKKMLEESKASGDAVLDLMRRSINEQQAVRFAGIEILCRRALEDAEAQGRSVSDIELVEDRSDPLRVAWRVRFRGPNKPK
jgi:hypothetical protein